MGERTSMELEQVRDKLIILPLEFLLISYIGKALNGMVWNRVCGAVEFLDWDNSEVFVDHF